MHVCGMQSLQVVCTGGLDSTWWSGQVVWTGGLYKCCLHVRPSTGKRYWQSMPAVLFASHTAGSGVIDSPKWLIGCSQICAPCSVSYFTICLTAVCKPTLAWLTNSIWHRLLCRITQLYSVHQPPKQYLMQTSHSGLNAPDKWQDRIMRESLHRQLN